MFRNDYQMDSPEYRTISEMMAKEPISSVTYGSMKLFNAQMSDYVVDIEWSPNVDRELAYYIECELYRNTISVGNTNRAELSTGLYTIDHYKNDCQNNSLINIDANDINQGAEYVTLQDLLAKEEFSKVNFGSLDVVHGQMSNDEIMSEQEQNQLDLAQAIEELEREQEYATRRSLGV